MYEKPKKKHFDTLSLEWLDQKRLTWGLLSERESPDPRPGNAEEGEEGAEEEGDGRGQSERGE